MSERARVLKIGGALLGLLVAGFVVGFLVLARGEESPTPAPTPPPASPLSVEAQVEQAYLHAWDVWAEALLELDDSRLPEILTGRALRTIQDQLEEQQDRNEPILLRADHDYRIVIIDETTASVDDRYLNRTVRLDPDTLEPVEEDPRQRLHTSFTMRLVDGTWKIAEIIRQDA